MNKAVDSALLKPSADRKVWAYKNHRNTFGLLPGPEGTCPGATVGPGGCRAITGSGRPDCYVYKIMRIYKGVRRVLEHNTRLLQAADRDTMVRLLNAEFSRFEQTGKGRVADKYRLHWSGDIFSPDYAWALKAAMARHPGVSFWTYTRSFDQVQVFDDLPNLQLYLSLDACNEQAGLEAYKACRRPTLHLCYMGDGNPGELAGEDFLECPVDSGHMALEGACHKCRLCLRGYNIWFKTKR